MAKLDDLIQQKQQRDEDWKAKKTAEREELGQLSDDAVMHVTSEPGAYLHYLDTQAINPRYSASNVMLAMAQNPEITYINSLEVWNRLGRSVNRDENGMKIRVSDTYVKDGREYHGYIPLWQATPAPPPANTPPATPSRRTIRVTSPAQAVIRWSTPQSFPASVMKQQRTAVCQCQSW